MTPQELALLEALEYAIDIVEVYQMDIRNSEWTGVDLEEKGFCQGRIYLRAVERIRTLAGQSPDAKPMTLRREMHGNYGEYKHFPRPCPYCGRSDNILDYFQGSTYYYVCDNTACGARGPLRPTQPAALAAWNGSPSL